MHFAFNCYAQDDKEEEALFVARKAFDDAFYDVSLQLLERFLGAYPKSPKTAEVNLLIGECYFYQSRFLDALKKFEELENNPQAKGIKDAVFYWTAEVHFRGNAFSKAAEYYRRVVDEFPDSEYAASSLYSLGWCLFQGAKFAEALKYFKAVEEKFPKDPQGKDSHLKIIECLYNMKEYPELKNKAQFFLRAGPKDRVKLGYFYFYLGESDYYLGNFNEAISSYAKVLDYSGDEKIKSLSRLGMAWSSLKLKKYNEAETIFRDIPADTLEKRSLDILLLGKAAVYFETARFSPSKDTYEELLKASSDPFTLVQGYLGQADALYNLAEYKGSISAYSQGLSKAAPEIPQEIIDKLHYGLSWAYLKEGKFKEAIDEFQKVAQFSEDKIVKISALCQIGDTYQDSGDYQKAADAYDKILKDYPDSFYGDYIQYQLGLVLVKMRNYDGAILAFGALKKNYPNSKLLDKVYYSLGLAYFQKEDYASSKEVFAKFQPEFKDSPLCAQAMYLEASSLYNLGKFSEAIEAFKAVIRSYGQDRELMQKAEYEIADCFYQMGNEGEAMSRFKTLRSRYPDSKLTAEVIWWLGEYYYRRNDLALARRYFTSLIQDFSKSNLLTSAYYALGSTYETEGRYDDAIESFKKVVSLEDSDLAATAAVAIADIYAKQDKLEPAIKTFRELIPKYPNLAHMIYPKLANIYRKAGNFDEALEIYDKSLNAVPVKQMADIQFKIAETYEAKADTGKAIEEYLKVTYLYSDNDALSVKAFLRVAQIYEGKEDFKEAANIYKKIADMNVQESSYARERIGWIKAYVK